MSVLGLWTLASALGCCIGFTIIQRPENYDYRRNTQEYQRQPPEYQWHSLEYQWNPVEYQAPAYDYPTNDYQSYGYQPYGYQPYGYQQYEYQPSYPSYGYYYYPLYELSSPYGYETKPQLPYAVGQQLLQVYRLIRVIVVFRDPIQKVVTSLDRLVTALADDALQQKLVELLCHVPGYEEVANLVNDPSVKLQNPFVNDFRRLLWAIQQALNAVDLTTALEDDLCDKLRELRDQANALTPEQIEAELLQGLKGKAKEALVTDVLENLLGEVETKDLEEFHEKYDLVVEGEDDDEPVDLDKIEQYLVVIDKPVKKELNVHHQIDEKALEDLAIALEQYVKEQQKSVEANQIKEKSTNELEQVVAPVTTAASTTEVYTTTYAPPMPIPTEAGKDTWLGSLFGKGNLLAGHYVPGSQKLPQPIDVSQPAVLIEPEQPEADKLWVQEESKNNEPLDFDIDQRFQGQAPTVASTEKTNSVTHSVPLWLIGNSKNQGVGNKQLEPEDIAEDQTEGEDELLRQLPEEEDEQEVDNEQAEFEDTVEARTEGDNNSLPELQENKQLDVEVTTEVAIEEMARENPSDENNLQTVEAEAEGPARFDLPVDLPDSKQLSTTPESVPIDEQQELQRLDVTTDTPLSVEQPTTINIYEVHTESIPIEAREEPTAVIQTATSEPDARRFVREEVLKVMNLLVESNGFTELKDHISEQDLNEVVDELSQVQMDIRWTEMISALQKLIASKQIDNGSQIVETLEHWKEGEEAHLDDGYFDRTYGRSDPAENRQIEEDETDMEQMELAQLQAAIMESRDLDDGDHFEAVTKRVLFLDDKDNYFDNLTSTETPESAESSTTEIPDESRIPRIMNVDDDRNEHEPSTQDPTVIDETSAPDSLQAEETTDELEETTPQPFPVNET